MKVLLIATKEEFNQESIDKIEKLADFEWVKKDKLEYSEILDALEKDTKILALSPLPVDWTTNKKLLDDLKNEGIEYICSPTTGNDWIDLDYARKIGINITNCPNYSTNAAAEYAIFMMLALLRKLPIQMQTNYKYEFTKENIGDELIGKKVGIIGLGNIGRRIADLTSSLGMEVSYWSRNKKEVDYKYMELDKLLSFADIVFPTYEINEETEDLLNKDKLAKLEEDACLINIMHGGLDQEYLIERVKSKKLAGYAFESDKINQQEVEGNVFITAPMAWYTKESLQRNIMIWTDTIISCIKGKPINLIN